jgi:hypothetical protein
MLKIPKHLFVISRKKGVASREINPQEGGRVMEGRWTTRVVPALAVAGLVTTGLGQQAIRPSVAKAALPNDAIVQGPLKIDNAAIADNGLAELNSAPGPRQTGFNQPGECVRSVARWLMAAGGPDLSGDDITTYTSLGAVTVDPANARKGDIVQYQNTGSDQNWASGVHTLVIVANNGDGTFWIVQSNAFGYDKNGQPVANYAGVVTQIKSWKPSPPVGFIAHFWRLGKVKSTIPSWAGGNTILREPNSGYSYTVDAWGARHWIPDGRTYFCLTGWYGYGVVSASWSQMAGLPEELASDGTPRVAACSVPDDLIGKIVRHAPSGNAYLVDGNKLLHWIPDGGTYLCLTGWLQKAVVNVDTWDAVNALPEDKTTHATCSVPDYVVGKILRHAPSGTAYVVDSNKVIHWIPDGRTYNCLTGWYGYSVVNVDTWDAVNALREDTSAHATCTVPDSLMGKILRHAPSGTAYVVDNAKTLHWIPDGGTYLCLTAWYGYAVVTVNTWDAINALPENTAVHANCFVPQYALNHVLRESDGTAYYLDGLGVRHWIPDIETWYCMIGRYPLINNLTPDHLNALPEGNWQPACLDPNRVKGKVVRETGGTAYWVDWSGTWHWIPDGGTYLCLVSRYALINNVTWAHINSIKREGAWATCS